MMTLKADKTQAGEVGLEPIVPVAELTELVLRDSLSCGLGGPIVTYQLPDGAWVAFETEPIVSVCGLDMAVIRPPAFV